MFLTEFPKILEFNAVAGSACAALLSFNRKQSAIHPLEYLAMFHPETRAKLPQAQAILSVERVEHRTLMLNLLLLLVVTFIPYPTAVSPFVFDEIYHDFASGNWLRRNWVVAGVDLPASRYLADEGIPVQTIAPKFSGRFNKGVDYAGDVQQFEREFALDVAAIAYAVVHFGLPDNLKLSVHSGSDKYSIYPAIYATMQHLGSGVHLKTAGTTWLEELIGLAEAGGEGLVLAKDIYSEAYAHRDGLCVPYASVIDIEIARLPAPDKVRGWTSEQYTAALRHVDGAAAFNSSFRQLLHVGFKVAAHMGQRYIDLIEANEDVIARNVTENLYDRHIAPVFLGLNQAQHRHVFAKEAARR
jgi:hypothetical protein